MRPRPPKPPLGSAYRCPSCALVDNRLTKIGAARWDGSDWKVSYEVVCNSCGAGGAVCPNPADARESWKLMSKGKWPDQPDEKTPEAEGNGTQSPMANPEREAEGVADEFNEQWLGAKQHKNE